MEQKYKLIENTVQPECKQDEESRLDGEENKYSSIVFNATKSNKMSSLSRIKAIQENDWKTWKGPLVKHWRRPGTAGITKSRARKESNILEEQDNLRLKNILKVILKMQSIDKDNICYLTDILSNNIIL